MVLSDGRKLFQIGLAVLIRHRRVTDSHPASQPASQTRCRSKDCAMLSRRAGKKKSMHEEKYHKTIYFTH